MITVHLDADSLVYSHGYMSDGKRYVIKGAEFQYKKEIVEFCTEHNLNKEDIKVTLSPNPLLVPMHSISNDINKIRIAAGGEDAEVVVHLTGKKQFREKVATIKPYKGNRTSEKPHWYKELREHLMQNHSALMHETIEADDAVVQAIAEDPEAIVAHIDKDIDQFQGKHYNFKHNESYEITEHEGLVNFYTQMVKGDGVDNIPGIFFLTKKKTPPKIREKIDALDTSKEMFQFVFSLYMDACALKGVEITKQELYHWLQETGTLLYMLRSKDDFYKHVLKLEEL